MVDILSSVGIGSATVGLVLPSSTVQAGETVQGTVEVNGGSAAQTVEDVYFALRTFYHTDETHHTETLNQFQLGEGFTVGPDEHLSFDVEIEVPIDTPVTWDDVSVWIETGLDIDWAVDPEDRDEITVEPDPYLATLNGALADLGFELQSARCVAATGTPFTEGDRLVQELAYRPIAAEYADRLDELEFLVEPGSDALRTVLEIDGKSDAMVGRGEDHERFDVETTDRGAVAERLRELIDRFV